MKLSSHLVFYQSSYDIGGFQFTVDGATVNGSSNGGSIVGTMLSTIEIDNDATISSPVWCGTEGNTVVILEDNSSNVTTGNTCTRVFRN